MRMAPVLTEKSHGKRACHIKRREKGGDAHQREECSHPAFKRRIMHMFEGAENSVLRLVSGEKENPRYGKHRDAIGPTGNGHLLPKPAHLPHVLFMVTSMYHRACTKEQTCLEERMRHHMKNGDPKLLRCCRHEHKTELAYQEFQPKSVVIAGGVAASPELRRQLSERLPLEIEYTDPKLCTDNGAMIATLGCFKAKKNQPTADPYALETSPNLSM